MENNCSLNKQANLRTIASQKLDEMLQELGISEEEFRTLNRWEKVAEISNQKKSNQNTDQESTDNENITDDSKSNREIDLVLGLKSRNEAIVKFKDSAAQETIKMEEMKKKYPNELIKFYEDQYFKNIPDTE